MIHIATVHWAHDRWIDIQLKYFQRNIDEPYRVYAWLDEGMERHSGKFFYSTDVPLKEQDQKVTDVGGNLLGLLEARGIEWYPLLRTNKVNPHPLQFGVYGDLVYHHGGGFRRTAGGRISWMPRRAALRSTWRGRLAARLPRRGKLGWLRRKIDPVHRYREALADQLADMNDRVFELIERDDDFYRQLIDPERGGELTKIKSPVPEDA